MRLVVGMRPGLTKPPRGQDAPKSRCVRGKSVAFLTSLGNAGWLLMGAPGTDQAYLRRQRYDEELLPDVAEGGMSVGRANASD
jgi:hypothetical protein